MALFTAWWNSHWKGLKIHQKLTQNRHKYSYLALGSTGFQSNKNQFGSGSELLFAKDAYTVEWVLYSRFEFLDWNQLWNELAGRCSKNKIWLFWHFFLSKLKSWELLFLNSGGKAFLSKLKWTVKSRKQDPPYYIAFELRENGWQALQRLHYRLLSGCWHCCCGLHLSLWLEFHLTFESELEAVHQ